MGGRVLRFILSALFVLFSGLAIFGQATHTSTPTTNTITRPGSIQDSGLYDYWTQMSGQGRAGGALLGQLKVEGEPLPWEPVLVTLTCNGKVVYTTQTDAKGNFAIMGIRLPGALGNQGDSERQMEMHFEGCVVQGEVPGFRSSTITITRRNLRDDPNLGLITIGRIDNNASTTISTTTETASAKAIKSFEKARSEMLQHNADAAARELQKTVRLDPQFAEAWLQLGKLQASSDPRAARDSFSKAIAADPKFILPYEQLAALAAQSGDWQTVLENTNQMAQAYPQGTAESWYLNAMANYKMGKVDAAEISARKSLALDPRHSIFNTEQLLAVILAGKGNFSEALKHLQSSLTYAPPGPDSDLLKQQIAQLEKRTGNK